MRSSSLARLWSLSPSYLLTLLALTLVACKPDGFINKVKYEGEKYVNTCTTFQTEIQEIIDRNQAGEALTVSKYNNTEFDFFYLEGGQYELKADTLYFRLSKDLTYQQYLDESVSIAVLAAYQSVEQLQDLENDPPGQLAPLFIDEAYFQANYNNLYLLYKIPLGGANLAGKQLSLSFAIAEFGKDGQLEGYFCESDQTPFGIIEAACCGAEPWQSSTLPTVITTPTVNVKTQTFVYSGFTGTIDVLFRVNSTNLGDDSTFSVGLIQNYIDLYQKSEYGVDKLALYGYASPPGRESYNQKLSQRRADAMKQGLMDLNLSLNDEDIFAKGYGEDWERVNLMITGSSFDAEQKAAIRAISEDTTQTVDEKEKALRRLPYFDQLREQILGPARHTLATMRFNYGGAVPTLEVYRDRLPLASKELQDVANQVFRVPPYHLASNPSQSYTTLEKVLTRTASPELYAIRATYKLNQGDVAGGLEDLEQATRFRGPAAENYQRSIQEFKVLLAEDYDAEEKRNLLFEYQGLIGANPSDATLKGNYAVLMEKVGLVGATDAVYEELLQGSSSASLLNNRGVARLKAFRLSEAEADFQAAIADDPDLAEPYFNLAAVYAYRGLPRKVVENLDLALAKDPALKAELLNNPVFAVVSEDSRFDKYRNEE